MSDGNQIFESALIGDLNLHNNQINTFNTNEDLLILPNGSGKVIVQSALEVIGPLRCEQILSRFKTFNNSTGTVVCNYDDGRMFLHTAPLSNWTTNIVNLRLEPDYSIEVYLMIMQGATPYIPTSIQFDGVEQTIYWETGAIAGSANKVDKIELEIYLLGPNTYLTTGYISAYG